MTIDSWLPISFVFPDGSQCGKPNHNGTNWQLISIEGGGQALIAKVALHEKWLASRLIDSTSMTKFSFGEEDFEEVPHDLFLTVLLRVQRRKANDVMSRKVLQKPDLVCSIGRN